MTIPHLLLWLSKRYPGVRFLDGQSLYLQGNPFARWQEDTLWYSVDGAAWNKMSVRLDSWLSANDIGLDRLCRQCLPQFNYVGRPLPEQKEVLPIMQSKESIKEASEKGQSLARLFSAVFQVQESIENPMDVMDLGWEFAKLQGLGDADLARAYSTGFGSHFLAKKKGYLLASPQMEMEPAQTE
jgi:hypothetical protein